MKPYLVTYDFYYDGELYRSTNYTRLLEEPYKDECVGEDFDSLWGFVYNHPGQTPFDMWEFKKGKKFLQHYDWFFKKITPENCRPWKFVVTSEETSISMDRLMDFDSDKVIQYLKERGITTCPIMK